MKKQLLALFLICYSIGSLSSQTLYEENFSTYTLTTVGSGNSTYYYKDVPSAMFTINNGNKTLANGTAQLPNTPFSAAGQNQKAWLVHKNPLLTPDTFAVSSSWLTPAGTADMWLITPTISGIDVSTVLTWQAYARDAGYADGYEVYVTTQTTNAPQVSDFTLANKVFSIASEGSSAWNFRSLSLGNYAGQDIRIAFRNNSNDQYQLWLDDIVVKNIPNETDMLLTSADNYKYTTVGGATTIKATIGNLGYAAINNFILNYQVGNGPVMSQIFTSNPAMNYYTAKRFSFASPYYATAPGYYDVKVWVSSVNGQTDNNHSNDTAKSFISVVTQTVTKNVFFEEYTGAWCGYCPDGYQELKTILQNNPNVIGASIHSGDNMETPEGEELADSYATGYPKATVDQFYFESYGAVGLSRANAAWTNYTNQRQTMITPVTATVTNVAYNSTTRQIDATVSATFVGEVKGDYRLNLYVTENYVYGPDVAVDNDWNQHSYLYADNTSDYYQVGTLGLVSGESSTALLMPLDYKHHHVVNQIVGGAFGTAGVIPTLGGTQGQTYTQTYSYTLPATTPGIARYNPDNTYLIGLVSEYNASTTKRAVLNAHEVKLTSNPEVVAVKELEAFFGSVSMYPNPTKAQTTLVLDLKTNETVTIEVVNLLGEIVHSESHTLSSGRQLITINTSNLAEGTYNITTSTKNGHATQKLIIIN